MIKLKNMSKTFSGSVVLKDISLFIPEGLITGIIGPNGAGKSTLLKIISGFESPDSGEIFISDNSVESFNQRKRYLSYMPEAMSLYPEYYVEEFLDFFHRAVDFRDDDLIFALSLTKVYQKKIKHLSKGWHQRLKLYTALCNVKPLLILDEPFDGFDPLQLREIINIFISGKKRGRSFILSIHQLSDAQKICDYFVLLDEGKLLATGTIEDLGARFSCESCSLEDIFLKALAK